MKRLVSLFTAFLIVLGFGISVQASELIQEKEGHLYESLDNGDSLLNNLVPVDNEVSPYAQIIELPGPIKHAGYVSNYNLGKLIEHRQKDVNWFTAFNILYGFIPGAQYAVAVNAAAMIVEGSPLDRMKQAYHSGEHMYVGEYYSTPQPGLSTVPFIIYTKQQLKFVSPNY